MSDSQSNKIILIGDDREENLSIRYLASYLANKGYEADVLDYYSSSQIPEVLEQIKKINPFLIGLSLAVQSVSPMYFELIEKIKSGNPKIYITVGGHFPTFDYEKILRNYPFIDTVIRFEGEIPIYELAEAVSKNESFADIKNLVWRDGDNIAVNSSRDEFPNLDKLPIPVRNEEPMDRMGEKFGTLVTSRGCWHSSCVYCCIGAFHSGKKEKFALRSPENVALEISQMIKRGIKLFQLHDDNFMLPDKEQMKERLFQLRKFLKEKDIDLDQSCFFVKARPDTVDFEVAKALKETAVEGCFLGIENACPSGLRSLARGTFFDKIEEALNALLKNDIAVTFNLLIFYPQTTLKEIEENIVFMKNHLFIPFDYGRAEVCTNSPLQRYLIQTNNLVDMWPHFDYNIVDEGVEKIYRTYLKICFNPKSIYSYLMHRNIVLGYYRQAFKKFYPGEAADIICGKITKIIEEINKFAISNLENIINFSRQGDVDLDGYIDEFNSKSLDLLKKIEKAEFQMEQMKKAEKIFGRFGLKNYAQKFYKTIL